MIISHIYVVLVTAELGSTYTYEPYTYQKNKNKKSKKSRMTPFLSCHNKKLQQLWNLDIALVLVNHVNMMILYVCFDLLFCFYLCSQFIDLGLGFMFLTLFTLNHYRFV